MDSTLIDFKTWDVVKVTTWHHRGTLDILVISLKAYNYGTKKKHLCVHENGQRFK